MSSQNVFNFFPPAQRAVSFPQQHPASFSPWTSPGFRNVIQPAMDAAFGAFNGVLMPGPISNMNFQLQNDFFRGGWGDMAADLPFSTFVAPALSDFPAGSMAFMPFPVPGFGRQA